MSAVLHARLAHPLPVGWHLAGPEDDDVWAALVDHVRGAFAGREVSAERIEGELDRARAFMRQTAQKRQWFVVTSEVLASPVPVVVAVGWLALELGPRPAAMDDLEPSSLPGVMTVASGLAEVGGRSTLLRHDLIVGADQAVRERVVAIGHDAEQGVQVALEVSTSDLSAFGDLVGAVSQLLAAFQWEAS